MLQKVTTSSPRRDGQTHQDVGYLADHNAKYKCRAQNIGSKPDKKSQCIARGFRNDSNSDRTTHSNLLLLHPWNLSRARIVHLVVPNSWQCDDSNSDRTTHSNLSLLHPWNLSRAWIVHLWQCKMLRATRFLLYQFTYSCQTHILSRYQIYSLPIYPQLSNTHTILLSDLYFTDLPAAVKHT